MDPTLFCQVQDEGGKIPEITVAETNFKGLKSFKFQFLQKIYDFLV